MRRHAAPPGGYMRAARRPVSKDESDDDESDEGSDDKAEEDGDTVFTVGKATGPVTNFVKDFGECA